MANIRKRDPEEMKRIAGQINSLMEQYRSKVKTSNEMIQNMKTYFDDPVSRNYVNKYEELKKDVDGVGTLMENYANLLSAIADQIDKSTTVG